MSTTTQQNEDVIATVARDDPTAGTKIVGQKSPGGKKYQTIIAQYRVGGASIKEVIGVEFHYIPRLLRYGMVAHASDGGPVLDLFGGFDHRLDSPKEDIISGGDA